MSDPIDVLIIGFGAVGTIYGYILSQNSNVRVTAIARGSFDEFDKAGIQIESEKFGVIEGWRPYRMVRNAEEANDRAYKYIIATFKCIPDLLPTSSVLAPFLESQYAQEKVPTVVLIQNGIGIEHPVQLAYPDVPIISVVAWIGANLKPNARVTHGMLEKLIIGLYKGEGNENEISPSGETLDEYADPAGYNREGGAEREKEGTSRTQEFAALLKGGGGGVEVVEDIQPARYSKTIWNASLSSICTMSRSTVSAVVAPEVLPFTLPVVRRTMCEVLYVARAWGYTEDVLPMKTVDDAIKTTISNYQRKTGVNTPGTPGVRSDVFGSQGYGFPDGDVSAIDSTINFKPSMLLDVENGRPCELEPLIGSLLERARARGVPTPRLDLVYASLKIHQDAVVRQYSESATHKAHIQDWLRRRPAVGGAGLEGRRAWEKAVRASEQASFGERVKVEMARGREKLAGRGVGAMEEAEAAGGKPLDRFD